MSEEYPKLYLEGIRLFNEEEFFECHDVLEELWTEIVGDERRFYQGLIQAAVGLFHFGNDNLGGARKMYHAAVDKLKAYPPRCLGMNLEKFLVDLKYCFQELLDAENTYPEGVSLRDERIPRIEFSDD